MQKDLPLLLLDNISMSNVVNEGEFKSNMLTFEEAKAIIEMYKEDDVIRCFPATPWKRLFSNILTLKGSIIHTKKFSTCAPGRMQSFLKHMLPRPRHSL